MLSEVIVLSLIGFGLGRLLELIVYAILPEITTSFMVNKLRCAYELLLACFLAVAVIPTCLIKMVKIAKAPAVSSKYKR